jgi:hypothetical protein
METCAACMERLPHHTSLGTPAVVALSLHFLLDVCVASVLHIFAGMSWQPTEHPWGQEFVEEAGWRAGAGWQLVRLVVGWGSLHL